MLATDSQEDQKRESTNSEEPKNINKCQIDSHKGKEISLLETDSALTKIRTGKAPGEDDLTPEIMKDIGPEGKHTARYRTGKSSQDWIFVISQIAKKD